jgi:serine/threonine protein kinase
MEEVGDHISILSKIGKGGFGSVYQCVDENGATFAMKKIKNDDNGIQCLMEASILNTIQHPNINRCIKSYASGDELYLISEEALGDLNNLTRKHGPPTLENLKIWSFGLVQAIACLHKHKILHCDIKGANVLLFPNNIVKLTDFTLGTKNWDNEKFTHSICTCTHRPPEVWLKKQWDDAVDIWALGVTLAEIALADYLFPYQEKFKGGKNLESKTINCLLDWGMKGPEGNQHYPIAPSDNQFLPFDCKYLTLDRKYQKFNSLIFPMLKLDPDKRPSIQNCLNHSFFRNENNELPVKESYSISTTVAKALNNDEYQYCIKNLRRFTMKSSLIDLSVELFSRTDELKFIPKYSRLMGCLWIASKIILHKPISSDIVQDDILAIERTICLHLNFKICNLIVN